MGGGLCAGRSAARGVCCQPARCACRRLPPSRACACRQLPGLLAPSRGAPGQALTARRCDSKRRALAPVQLPSIAPAGGRGARIGVRWEGYEAASSRVQAGQSTSPTITTWVNEGVAPSKHRGARRAAHSPPAPSIHRGNRPPPARRASTARRQRHRTKQRGPAWVPTPTLPKRDQGTQRGRAHRPGRRRRRASSCTLASP